MNYHPNTTMQSFTLMKMIFRVDTDPRAVEYIMGNNKQYLKRYCKWLKMRYGDSIYIEYVYPKNQYQYNEVSTGYWRLTAKWYSMLVEASNWIKQKEDEFFSMLESGLYHQNWHSTTSQQVKPPTPSKDSKVLVKPKHIRFSDGEEVISSESKQLRDWVDRMHC